MYNETIYYNLSTRTSYMKYLLAKLIAYDSGATYERLNRYNDS